MCDDLDGVERALVAEIEKNIRLQKEAILAGDTIQLLLSVRSELHGRIMAALRLLEEYNPDPDGPSLRSPVADALDPEGICRKLLR